MPVAKPDLSKALGRSLGATLVGRSLLEVIDCYWSGLSHLQNTLEDVEGADGRIEYARALRMRLLSVAFRMDRAGSDALPAAAHQAALTLQYGLQRFGLTGEEVYKALLFSQPSASAEDLTMALKALIARLLSVMPGEIPQAQGTTGQREILRAMRMWSVSAEALGHDLGFLAGRLQEI